MANYQQHPSSFRDPSGFVFEVDGKLYRQINVSYANDYDLLMNSGLYEKLTAKKWLIAHSESNVHTSSPGRYKTILPDYIRYQSYPYEWCFEQIQDAGLLTLEIMKASLEHGMILKDATPYNIQFLHGRPIHIDTLSFEKYNETEPWNAYRQFCETFLYPLLVSKYTLLEVHRTFLAYPEGIPSTVTAELLPFRSRFNLGNWLHVFLPASVSRNKNKSQINFSKKKLLQILEHLESLVRSAKTKTARHSAWKNYYDKDILSQQYLDNKQAIVKQMVDDIQECSILDAGCNQGLFSLQLAEKQNKVVAIDADDFSISHLYKVCGEKNLNILPLCIDITNPPGDSGFGNKERKSFKDRMKFDLSLALALVHHLSIGKNIPFKNLAAFFSSLSSVLIIEFVPKEDEKVRQLLSTREDIFSDYDAGNFENAFKEYFSIEDRQPVPASVRTIYRMKKLERS